MIEKLASHEFTFGFAQYRVFSAASLPVSVQVLSSGGDQWIEIRGRHRETILEAWREECRQLSLDL